MNSTICMEICVDSLSSAISAEKGGADRIELCDNLVVGGTTPSAAMIELARKYLTIGIHVLIRPRCGDFCYSPLEWEVMKRDIEIAKRLGVNGIVTGVLQPNGEIDVDMMKELLQWARPLTVTFHRAFDMTRDPLEALDTLISLGVERVLTSGRKSKAILGVDLIRELVQRAQNQIIIMPGAGISAANVKDIIANTGVKEVHMSLKEKVDSVMKYRNDQVAMGGNLILSEYETFFTSEKAVRTIREILR